MSLLRWFGLIVGLLFALIFFARFRRAAMRRLDFTFAVLFSFALILVSLVPDSVNVLRSMFALEDAQYGRLIAILILSNLLLWMLLIYTRIQRSGRDDQFDRLVRRLGIQEFGAAYPELRNLAPVVVVIPAYNEAENIGHVLKAMPKTVCGVKLQTIVIDDGSSDATLETAREAGALAVRSPINRGGGAALRLGFDLARQGGAEIVVTMDADGQHLPEEIERLVEPIIDDRYEFVIGSRILGRREKDSVVRFIGIHVFNWLIRLLTPAKITDCSNGFRALRIKDLERIELRQDQFHTSELIIDAARRGIRIGEAPITVKRRLSGESKKGRDFTYGLAFARTILKSWWR